MEKYFYAEIYSIKIFMFKNNLNLIYINDFKEKLIVLNFELN